MKLFFAAKIQLSFLLVFFVTLPDVQAFNSNTANSTEHDTVKIGNQIWMFRNLDVSVFQNGDSIPEAKTEEAWVYAAENGLPAWCYYENDSANGAVYGKLYNWFAVNDSRGLAPEGWRIPDEDDWNALTMQLEGVQWAGLLMKCETSWENSMLDGEGLNESGFTALPGGYRTAFAWFSNMGSSAYWWSAAEDPDDEAGAFHRGVTLNSNEIRGGTDNFTKGIGFSVRCIKQ